MLACLCAQAQDTASQLQGLREANPLHYELAMRHYDHALEKMPLVTDIDAQDDMGLGITPLGLAASDESADAYDVVHALLSVYGADSNVPDGRGLLPLHHAAAAGNLAVVTMLLNYGADVDADCGQDTCTAPVTPLYMAYANQRTRVASFLLSRGAKDLDEDVRDQVDVQAAISAAGREAMETARGLESAEDAARYQFEQMANAAIEQLSNQGRHVEAQVWEQSQEVILQALRDIPMSDNMPAEQWQRIVVHKALEELQSTLAPQQQEGGK